MRCKGSLRPESRTDIPWSPTREDTLFLYVLLLTFTYKLRPSLLNTLIKYDKLVVQTITMRRRFSYLSDVKEHRDSNQLQSTECDGLVYNCLHYDESLFSECLDIRWTMDGHGISTSRHKFSLQRWPQTDSYCTLSCGMTGIHLRILFVENFGDVNTLTNDNIILTRDWLYSLELCRRLCRYYTRS